jgi:hypothetical protein
MIAVQNARLYRDLVEEIERMVEVQEEARRKLARDLHDGKGREGSDGGTGSVAFRITAPVVLPGIYAELCSFS